MVLICRQELHEPPGLWDPAAWCVAISYKRSPGGPNSKAWYTQQLQWVGFPLGEQVVHFSLAMVVTGQTQFVSDVDALVGFAVSTPATRPSRVAGVAWFDSVGTTALTSAHALGCGFELQSRDHIEFEGGERAGLTVLDRIGNLQRPLASGARAVVIAERVEGPDRSGCPLVVEHERLGARAGDASRVTEPRVTLFGPISSNFRSAYRA